jgi:hypothetical protein
VIDVEGEANPEVFDPNPDAWPTVSAVAVGDTTAADGRR